MPSKYSVRLVILALRSLLRSVPSINVIQHKNHASDGQVMLDAREGKRDFVESGLEKGDFGRLHPSF